MAAISDDKSACQQSCKKIDVPTEEEVAALNQLRSIKDRLRQLRKQISDVSAGLVAGATREDLVLLESQVAELKEEWLVWEDKRQQAARDRMMILGHESPAVE